MVLERAGFIVLPEEAGLRHYPQSDTVAHDQEAWLCVIHPVVVQNLGCIKHRVAIPSTV